MTNRAPEIGTDQPLETATALTKDKLDRTGFARSVVAALTKVSSSSGFVVSVEGEWGSGKTSTLALIEALLEQQPVNCRPIVVRFNPWLVGERDALLRHFLATLASAIQLGDSSKDAKKAAKELKTYAKAFDFVKLIPGAEPWASLVKSVIEAAGNATESIADYKTPDIEEHKNKVERALRQYERPIIVVVDDIDRLFPQEVFEMVRIVKAVGDLPNVGYLLAWDTAYVSAALASAKVPKSETYLDKIVQVRMPLPSLSTTAREQLINDALDRLDPEALKSHFPNDQERLGELYFDGLRDVLEQPRDVTRVFNLVSVMEPSLRGELAFSDIVGLASLAVRAPAVADLVRKQPRWFVGLMPSDNGLRKKSIDLIKEGAAAREQAYGCCSRPQAVQAMVHFLFPMVAEADGTHTFNRVQDTEGHIASPTRLAIALQLSVSSSEVSLVLARKYMSHPEERMNIARDLSEKNCHEFLEQLADLAANGGKNLVTDLPELCLAIARLVDTSVFTGRTRARHGMFTLKSATVARRTISALVEAIDITRGHEVAKALVNQFDSISVAAEVIGLSFAKKESLETPLLAPASSRSGMVKTFSNNVLSAASDGSLMRGSSPGYVLWILSAVAKSKCKDVYSAIKANDPSLDSFAFELLKDSYDSVKGQTFALDKERLIHFVSIEEFRSHAEQRVLDTTLHYPVRAAWQAVVAGKRLYAVDGTEVD